MEQVIAIGGRSASLQQIREPNEQAADTSNLRVQMHHEEWHEAVTLSEVRS